MSYPIKFSWRIVGLWYLTFPVILFFFFWLRAPYNIIFTIITIGVGLKYTIELSKSLTKVRVNYRYLILTLCISLIFAILSGAGGFVWQKPDWTKHNVVLNDLINYRWPVNYGPSAYVKDTSLVYYVAYYLPAALIGKLFGWRAGELGLFIQTWLGIFIFAQLIGDRIRSSVMKYLLFFFMSGADIIGIFLFRDWSTIIHPQMLHLEYYATSLQFSSVMTQLMWVPQHAISGWIGVMLAYKDYQDGKILRTLPLYVAITFLWSPFISLGLALIFMPFVISKNIKLYFNLYTVAGLAITALTLLYYQSQLYVWRDKATIYFFHNEFILNNVGMMIAFLILDLYVFAIFFVYIRDRIDRNEIRFIAWLIILLILIPQVMFGTANDFDMRVSIPALTLTFVFVLRYINELFKKKSIIKLLIIFLFVCGMCTPFAEIIQAYHKTEYATNERPTESMINAHLRYKVLHQQYMGLATKAFGRYFGNYVLDSLHEK